MFHWELLSLTVGLVPNSVEFKAERRKPSGEKPCDIEDVHHSPECLRTSAYTNSMPFAGLSRRKHHSPLPGLPFCLRSDFAPSELLSCRPLAMSMPAGVATVEIIVLTAALAPQNISVSRPGLGVPVTCELSANGNGSKLF